MLLGDTGTGKTHLLIGLGLAACEQGRRVRYVTTAAPGQRARRGRRRPRPVPRRRPLRPPRPALPRRTRLRPDRPPRRRAALPDHHRTRRTSLDRDRHQPPVQRMGNRLHRPPPGRRDRRPGHLQRPHPRDRHPVLPAPHHQNRHPHQESQLTNDPPGPEFAPPISGAKPLDDTQRQARAYPQILVRRAALFGSVRELASSGPPVRTHPLRMESRFPRWLPCWLPGCCWCRLRSVMRLGSAPQSHRGVPAAAGEQAPVRAESHRLDRAAVAGESAHLSAGGWVP